MLLAAAIVGGMPDKGREMDFSQTEKSGWENGGTRN